MPKGRKTTLEERLEIVDFTLVNNKDYHQTIEKYQVSYLQVYNWVRKYESSGKDGLLDRRGRNYPPEKMTETAPLEAELKEIYGFTQSMSRAGYCIDNQPIERFFGTLKAEYYYRKTFSSTGQLEQGINHYIDFYNWRRVTLTFEGLSPMIFRKEYQEAT